MLTVRSAKASDEEAVYGLINELEDCEFHRETFKCIYLENLKSKDAKYFVAEDDGIVTGFVSVQFQRLLHHVSEIAEIQELIVTKNQRQSGAGGMLLERAKAEAEKRGCPLIEVSCGNQRTASHDFYLAKGMGKTHLKFTLKL